MFKFLLLGVLLCQEVVNDVYGQPAGDLADTNLAELPAAAASTNNNSNKGLTLGSDGRFNFQASQQVFYLQNPFARKNPAGFTSYVQDDFKKLDADYVVTNGMGAHKVHIRKLPWNRARRVCIEEGGHLAVIRTEAEEKIILQIMLESAMEEAWIGYHDKFEEGDWISVLDEPLGQTGWARWSKKFTPNPDNLQGKQHCARLVKNGGGMDDANCDDARPFICKVLIA